MAIHCWVGCYSQSAIKFNTVVPFHSSHVKPSSSLRGHDVSYGGLEGGWTQTGWILAAWYLGFPQQQQWMHDSTISIRKVARKPNHQQKQTHVNECTSIHSLQLWGSSKGTRFDVSLQVMPGDNKRCCHFSCHGYLLLHLPGLSYCISHSLSPFLYILIYIVWFIYIYIAY